MSFQRIKPAAPRVNRPGQLLAETRVNMQFLILFFISTCNSTTTVAGLAESGQQAGPAEKSNRVEPMAKSGSKLTA